MDYERTDDFSRYEELLKEEDGRIAYVKTTHVFEKPGTYFPVLKARRQGWETGRYIRTMPESGQGTCGSGIKINRGALTEPYDISRNWFRTKG